VADAAEQALIEIKKYRFLEQQVVRRKPEIYEAVVVKVKNFGMFVELTRLRIQGLVHISSVSKDLSVMTLTTTNCAHGGGNTGAGSRVKVKVVRGRFLIKGRLILCWRRMIAGRIKPIRMDIRH